MQNLAAIHCYGNEKNALETAANAFYKRFIDSNVVEQAMACITAGEVFSIEAQVNTLNGIRWHGIDVRRTNDPINGQPLILINEREISDRKQVEEQLQKYAAQLQQVLTFEAMLKRITDKVRDSFDESQILQTAVRELALVTKVRCCNTALYNLEQGTSTICYEHADSGLVAQACVMQITVFPDVYQLSDSTSLRRIIVELLNNAYKYTPAGGKILVTACVLSDKMQIAISNFGVEIPVNELPRIFEKFYRIPSIDPWKQGGTGLGLALIQSLVKQLGGTI